MKFFFPLFLLCFTSSLVLAEEDTSSLNLPEQSKPSEITVEQKVQVKMPLVRNIDYMANNYRPSEITAVVDAMKTLDANNIRRQNLGVRPTERIKVEDIKVKADDPDDVSRYFNAKITNTLLSSLPKEDSSPSSNSTEKSE